MRSLVFGDSQAQAMGPALARLVGGADVVAHPGKSRSSLKALLPHGGPWERAWVFAGGNDASGASALAVVDLLRTVPAQHVTYVPPPPMTHATDPGRLKSVFGQTDPDHWLQSGKAQAREAKAATFAEAARHAGFDVADLRDGLQPFPDLPDGVHVTGPVADQAVGWLARRAARGSMSPWVVGALLAAIGLFVWRRRGR